MRDFLKTCSSIALALIDAVIYVTVFAYVLITVAIGDANRRP